MGRVKTPIPRTKVFPLGPRTERTASNEAKTSVIEVAADLILSRGSDSDVYGVAVDLISVRVDLISPWPDLISVLAFHADLCFTPF